MRSGLPLTGDGAVAAAAALAMPIPATCLAGVVANLALLDRHARILLEDIEDTAR